MIQTERRQKLSAALQSDLESLMTSQVLQEIGNGRADPRSVWLVFSQYQYYCKSFPLFLEAILTRTTSVIARQPLLDNLWEEAGSGDVAKSHPAMLETFLESWGFACGIPKPQMLTSEPSRPVVSFVEDILTFLRTAPLPAAFGFLGPGTEEITSQQYKLILRGLRSYGLVDELKFEFFSAHITADIKHAEAFWDALEDVARTEDDWLNVERGARESLKREVKFWKEMAGLK